MAASSSVVTLPTSPTSTATPADLLLRLEAELNTELVERREQVHALVVSFLARAHMFALGEPGVAKTMMFERAAKRIGGARFFSTGIGKLSPLEQVIGPVDLLALKDNVFRRVSGYAQDSHIALLDEGMKGSQALLNMFLRWMNERTFEDQGQTYLTPTFTICIASNEEIEGPELEPFNDRILVRVYADDVVERRNLVTMLKLDLVENPQPVLSLDDLMVAQKEAAAIPIPDNIYEDLVDLRKTLREAGIRITPRRLRQTLPLLRAEAYLDGAPEVQREHLAFLVNALWTRYEQSATVEGIVLALANPLQKEALELLASIEKLGTAVEDILTGDQDLITTAANEVQKKIKQANAALKVLEAKPGTSRRQAELVVHCRKRHTEITTRLLSEVFNLGDEAIRNMLAGKSPKGD